MAKEKREKPGVQARGGKIIHFDFKARFISRQNAKAQGRKNLT